MTTTHSLGIDSRLLKAIQELGFSEFTEIQQKAIPSLITGTTDFIGLAQTGTGKTAAFGIPLIQRIDATSRFTQALVLCPTRELCLQITTELRKYGKFVDGLNVVAVYGGADIRTQIRDLKYGAHIVVGTPGRLIDHMERGTIKTESVMTVILDEADQMLDMGFQEPIDTIIKAVNPARNIWLFSATMHRKVEKIAHTYMKEPIQVTVGSRNSSAKNIDHQYCMVRSSDKYTALTRYLDFYADMFGIMFCRTRSEAQELSSALVRDGYWVDAIHGDLSQAQRDTVMQKFRTKKLQLLVATDVAARGIDVDDVTHVIQYNLPDDIENYTHRSGRTARAGKSGLSLIIATSRDISKIKMIERSVGTTMARVLVPTADQICANKIDAFIKKFVSASASVSLPEQAHIKLNDQLLALSKEELIKRIVALGCADIAARYAQTYDINAPEPRHNGTSSFKEGHVAASRGRFSKEGHSASSRRSHSHASSSSRFYINVGREDGYGKKGLVELICGKANVQDRAVNDVVVQNRCSFFTVDPSFVDSVLKGFKSVRMNGRPLRVELSTGK